MHKIARVLVLDNMTGAILPESIFEMYDGPMAQCKTGGADEGTRAGRAFVKARPGQARVRVTNTAFRRARQLGPRARARFVKSANRVINRNKQGASAKRTANRAAAQRRGRATGRARRR